MSALIRHALPTLSRRSSTVLAPAPLAWVATAGRRRLHDTPPFQLSATDPSFKRWFESGSPAIYTRPIAVKELTSLDQNNWRDPAVLEDFALMMQARKKLAYEQTMIDKVYARYAKVVQDAQEFLRDYPERPKRNNGFLLFEREFRHAQRNQHPRLSSQGLAARWRSLSLEDKEEFNERARQAEAEWVVAYTALYESYGSRRMSLIRRYLRHEPLANAKPGSYTEKALRRLPPPRRPPMDLPRPPRQVKQVSGHSRWIKYLQEYRLQHPKAEGEPAGEWFARSAKEASTSYKLLKLGDMGQAAGDENAGQVKKDDQDGLEVV